MLNDIFIEDMVKHKRETKDILFSIGLIFAALIVSFLAALFAAYTLGLWLLIIAGAWFGAIYLIRGRSLEYEYVVTNDILDIDRIAAQRKRKRMCSINFKEITCFAPVDSEKFRDQYVNKPGIQEEHDFTGDGETQIYFIDFNSSEKMHRVLIQPKHKIVEAARRYNPRLVEEGTGKAR